MTWMWQSILRQAGIVMVTALLSLLWARSLECRLDCLEQVGRDLGENAKPGLERKSRLVEQQAEPIDRDAAALPRRGQKRRLERRVDQIGDQRGGRQSRQIDIKRRF